MSVFNLTKNAFAILGTNPRANRAQLEESYQDSLLEADDHGVEAALNRAQQSLISPRDRLENEFGFFINTKPATVKIIIASLKDGAVNIPYDGVAGLDRINLLAHLCGIGRRSERIEQAQQLIAAYETFSFEETLRSLSALRTISGFGAIDAAQSKTTFNRITRRSVSAGRQER